MPIPTTSALAQALMSIGQNLPLTMRQKEQDRLEQEILNREEEDRKSRNVLNDLAIRKTKLELEDTERKNALNQQGSQALDQYQEERRISPAVLDLSQGKELSMSPTPYSLDYLSSKKPKTKLELAEDAQLPKYSAYNEGAKNTLDQINKDEANGFKYGNSKDGKISWGNKTGLIVDYRTPEKMKYVRQKLDEFKQATGLDEETYQQKISDIENGEAYNVSQYINDEYAGRQSNRLDISKAYGMVGPKAESTAATTAATENTKRKIQAGNPILSEAQSGSLSDSYNAINYLNTLKGALQSNNLGYFDIDRKTGQFVNPEMADAFLQLVEIVGRKRSGAAISESEWSNFGKQVLNKNNLLTEKGKETALKSIDRYLDKFYGSGVTTAGNKDWYKSYQSNAKGAREMAEGKTDAPETSSNDWTDAKAKRLAELRAKKASGTLGR